MVTTTRDDYSNRDYTKGDYPTFNDIEYQAEMETYLEKNPLARVALKSIMNTTKGNVSKVLQNVDDDDDSKDLWTKIYGVSSSVPGYIGVPSDPDKFQQYSEEEQNINPIMRIKLSSLDSDKQKTVTGHELGHFGLRVLLDEGFIDKKLFDKLQLPDKEKPKVSTEERLMHKLSSRDDYFAGTKDTGFLSNNISKTLDSIAEDYLSGIAKEDLGYAKGGDTMPMEKQMELFAVGGLDDDGLSRDPVSGNEIPPGSMANEVRDDVEARLSDGEYVVPANVVRFFGVKFFEDLRTQAMQGLADMEANGRIGGQPVPADMPMQDQMAQGQPPISDGEMEMLQSMMNKGGYIQGYQTGGTPDFENPSNYPFNPSPFLTVGGSYLSPNNPNVTPDPNLPPTTMPVDPSPSPESGISMVTMVNPATNEIQVVQFMGGEPVDLVEYNQLLNSGYFVQGSPELTQYKQQQDRDNIESDRQMGGDKLQSIEDLIKSDFYGQISLGPTGQVLGSALDKAFPTRSTQTTIDYIIKNNKFPPTGKGIRDTSKPLMGNGQHPFKRNPDGTIQREEASTGPRNVAKEAVAYLKESMRIKNKHIDKNGKLNNKAYRADLIKSGLAKGDLFTTVPISYKDWYATSNLAKDAAKTGKTLADFEENVIASGGTFTPDDNLNQFPSTDDLIGSAKGYKPTTEEAEESNKTPTVYSSERQEAIDEVKAQDYDTEEEKQTAVGQVTGKGYVGGSGFNKGGLLKKPIKKKKTKTKK